MAEYLPARKPGTAPTYKASAPITGGQMVAISGSDTVAPAGANSTAWVGVAQNDAAVNDNVVVWSGGSQSPVASGSIAAGDLVACAASGQVATSATPTTGQLVGVAERAATSGNKVRVKFAR